ncbi:MAG: GxxExxY protein [Gemmatimonadaceae bacterium]|nr:GxxExxY protein [Gemmatimonadaceae bacterium]
MGRIERIRDGLVIQGLESRLGSGMTHGDLIEGALTRSVIGAFFEVYNTLGYGFLEHLYVMAMERELLARDHTVAREISIRVMYKGEELGTQRLDMIVDDRLVVEIKSTFQLPTAAQRQLYSYLRATNLEVGLLLHFGPEPKFYRHISRNPQKQSAFVPDPDNPDHPVNPIPPVIDAAEASLTHGTSRAVMKRARQAQQVTRSTNLK